MTLSYAFFNKTIHLAFNHRADSADDDTSARAVSKLNYTNNHTVKRTASEQHAPGELGGLRSGEN